ncbi:TIR domain-containing protein [Streptomyces sp. NPDC050529]|uniref:WD40 domain-containing protein n=1 Tax=Streptomyces sp. NPDC050529 TaxID=3365624 RepID=UPI003799B6BA
MRRHIGVRDSKQIDAFISYSRAADSRLAPSIQRGLTRLAKKWYRIRALNVFRDQTDLSASHALGASIEEALTDARFFVLLASPAAAESKWVRREIEFWQRNKASATFIIALTDGTIRWDDEAGDFDWSITDALPRNLSGYFEAEPLWQDLTWSRDADRLSLRHSGFRDAVAALAAPVHGSSKRELDNEEVKAHRILTLIGVLATAMIVILTLAFGAQYWLAAVAKDQADENARDATVMSAIRRAQDELANASTGYDVSAYQWLGAARSLASRPSTEGAVYNAALAAAYSRPNLLRVTEPEPGLSEGLAAMTADGMRIAFERKGQPVLWSPHTGRASGPALESRATKDSKLLALAFNRDGSRLAAAYSTAIVLWDMRTGRRINEFAKDANTTESVAISPDGRTVAVAGGGLRLWDTSSGRPIGKPVTATGSWVVFASDSRKLAFDSLNNGGSEVRVRNVEPDDADEVALPYPHNQISSIAFAPDGRALAVGTDDGRLRLWNPDSGKPAGRIMSGHQGAIKAITFGADGSRMATAGDDKTIRQWDTATGAEFGFPLTGHAGPVDFIAFSRSGRELVSLGEDATLRRWDAMSGLRRTRLGTSAPVALAADPRGKNVAVGGPDGVRLWNQETGAQGATLHLPRDVGVESLSYSPDGTSLLIVSADGLRVWDGTTARAVTLAPSTGPVSSAVFMPHGKQIVVGSYAGKLLFQDLDAHAVGTTSASIDIACPPAHLTVSQDGMRLAYVCDGKGGIADAKARRVRTFSLEQRVTTAVFSPDGRTLLLGSLDGTVWRRKDDLNTFVAVGVHRGAVRSVAYSPDGNWFASAGDDGSVIIYPHGSKLISARISAHTGPVAAIAFSRDSGHLVSLGTTDNAAHIWHIFPDPLGELCKRVTYNMSESAWKDWVSDRISYQDQCAGKPRAERSREEQ